MKDLGRKPFVLDSDACILNSRKGFTLLEVLIAVAILGVAVSIVLQLFSANLRALSASSDYVAAAALAEAKMRWVLDDNALTEKSLSETTNDGYRIDVSVTEVLKDRTENLQLALMEVSLTIHWTSGSKEKSLTVKTMKSVQRQV